MFSTIETILRHGGMFQGSDEVYKPLFYYSGRAIHFALTCLYSAVYLESFFYYNGVATTDFGLQRPTGPSSGVVASILLVSPGLDCLGVILLKFVLLV